MTWGTTAQMQRMRGDQFHLKDQRYRAVGDKTRDCVQGPRASKILKGNIHPKIGANAYKEQGA